MAATGLCIRGRLAPELSRLSDSFNRMTARLTASDAENRQLNEQLLTLQEQERNDLARDLHDEVSPYLFAISVDTASTRAPPGRTFGRRCGHLHSIADAVRHMQQQVSIMLGRLRPIGFADAGSSERDRGYRRIWRRRCPEIRYRWMSQLIAKGLEPGGHDDLPHRSGMPEQRGPARRACGHRVSVEVSATVDTAATRSRCKSPTTAAACKT